MRAVKNLKKVVAVHATEIAVGAGSRHQFNAPVARFAFGTGDIGLSHGAEVYHPMFVSTVKNVCEFVRGRSLLHRSDSGF